MRAQALPREAGAPEVEIGSLPGRQLWAGIQEVEVRSLPGRQLWDGTPEVEGPISMKARVGQGLPRWRSSTSQSGTS